MVAQQYNQKKKVFQLYFLRDSFSKNKMKKLFKINRKKKTRMSKRREEEGGGNWVSEKNRHAFSFNFNINPKSEIPNIIYNYYIYIYIYIYSLTNHKKSKLYFQFPFHITLHARFLSHHHHHKGIRSGSVDRRKWMMKLFSVFSMKVDAITFSNNLQLLLRRFFNLFLFMWYIYIYIKHASTFSSVFVFNHFYFQRFACNSDELLVFFVSFFNFRSRNLILLVV